MENKNAFRICTHDCALFVCKHNIVIVCEMHAVRLYIALTFAWARACVCVSVLHFGLRINSK